VTPVSASIRLERGLDSLQQLQFSKTAIASGREQLAPRCRTQRPGIFVVCDTRFSRNDFNVQLARLQRLTIGFRERAQMHAELPARRISDVKELCKFAERPVLQNMIPPGIVLGGGHVIWDDVEQDPESQGVCGPHENRSTPLHRRDRR